jgi:hypothetical protein
MSLSSLEIDNVMCDNALVTSIRRSRMCSNRAEAIDFDILILVVQLTASTI